MDGSSQTGWEWRAALFRLCVGWIGSACRIGLTEAYEVQLQLLDVIKCPLELYFRITK